MTATRMLSVLILQNSLAACVMTGLWEMEELALV